VLSDTIHEKNTSEYSQWGEAAALENVTLAPAGDTTDTLSLLDFVRGSSPLDVYDLGFPFGKQWVSFPLVNCDLMVNTYGHRFNGAVMNTTELAPYENQSGYKITVTYYTFTGQLDLLYLTLAKNATFYLATRSAEFRSQPFEPFNLDRYQSVGEGRWYKIVSLPAS
jgi:hypothetical protein